MNIDKGDTLYILTGSVNEACGCHPEYRTWQEGAFTDLSKLFDYRDKQPTSQDGRHIDWDYHEVIFLG